MIQVYAAQESFRLRDAEHPDVFTTAFQVAMHRLRQQALDDHSVIEENAAVVSVRVEAVAQK